MDQKQSSSKTSKSKQDKPFSTTSAREDLASITSSSTSRNEDEEPPTNDLLMKEKNILDQQEQLLDGSISSEAEDSDQDQRASGSKRPRSQEQKKLDRILANRRSARRSRERRKQLQENLEKSVLLLQKQNEKLSQENSSLKNDLNFLLSLLSNDRKITELPSSRAATAIQQQLLQQTSSTSHQSQLDLQQELLLQLANQQRYQQALSVGNINQNNGVKGITANQFSTILADATRTSTTTQQQRNHQNTTLDPTSLLFHANNRF